MLVVADAAEQRGHPGSRAEIDWAGVDQFGSADGVDGEIPLVGAAWSAAWNRVNPPNM